MGKFAKIYFEIIVIIIIDFDIFEDAASSDANKNWDWIQGSPKGGGLFNNVLKYSSLL